MGSGLTQVELGLRWVGLGLTLIVAGFSLVGTGWVMSAAMKPQRKNTFLVGACLHGELYDTDNTQTDRQTDIADTRLNLPIQ